jgi:DNA-directed RNA polymerase specialized sigma subunit
MEIQFEHVEKSLYRQAWIANSIYPAIPFEDFISAGHDIFLNCLSKYKKTKNCRFNTYFTACCKKYFKGMICKEAEKASRQVDEEIELQSYSNQNTITPEALVIFKDTLLNLPEDARVVIELIFNDPNTFRTKGSIRAYLRNIWSGQEIQNRITDAFNTINHALKTFR